MPRLPDLWSSSHHHRISSCNYSHSLSPALQTLLQEVRQSLNNSCAAPGADSPGGPPGSNGPPRPFQPSQPRRPSWSDLTPRMSTSSSGKHPNLLRLQDIDLIDCATCAYLRISTIGVSLNPLCLWPKATLFRCCRGQRIARLRQAPRPLYPH